MDKVRNSIKASLLSLAQALGYLIVVLVGTAILYELKLFEFDRVKICWSIIIILGLILVIRWNTRSFSYQCVKCGHKFDISAWTNAITPGGYYKLFIKCPKCHQRTKAALIDKVKK
jgi:DNA-directed RNA polymerase subunit RPC12/RpoP